MQRLLCLLCLSAVFLLYTGCVRHPRDNNYYYYDNSSSHHRPPPSKYDHHNAPPPKYHQHNAPPSKYDRHNTPPPKPHHDVRHEVNRTSPQHRVDPQYMREHRKHHPSRHHS